MEPREIGSTAEPEKVRPQGMRIVVLDGHTLNPGDLSWGPLEALGQVTLYDRTRPEEIVLRAQGAEVILTNKTPLDRTTLQHLPGLRYVGVLATGYNVVDAKAARELGVVVTNVPNYGTRSVAQQVFALLLELTQRTGAHAAAVRTGRWSACPDFCFWDHPLVELDGLTLGVVGFGRIGQATATLAAAFGMTVLATTRQGAADPAPGVRGVDLDTLLAESDVVSLHCPLTPATTGLINAARLARMKPSAYLINTSRGPLIEEADLADALNADRLAGAGLDVLSLEPPHPDNPLLTAKNCLITPHIAWATLAARSRLLDVATNNVAAFVRGQPVNVVN
jgi:glycerate dehydrogenase